MVAFPTLPDFNFNGSNPLADAVQEFKGQLSASGYLDKTLGEAIGDVGALVQGAAGELGLPLSALAGAFEFDSGSVVQFPLDIENINNYMAFDVFEERIFEASVGVKKRTNRKKIVTIKLPMPSSLQTAYAQGYKQEGIGPIGAAAANEMGDFAKKALGGGFKGGSGLETMKNMGAGLMDSGKKVLDNIGAEGAASLGMAAADDIAGVIGSAAGDLVGAPGIGAVVGDQLGKVVQAGAASAGIARNPHMAVLYEAPNFRTFQFSFDLRARNRDESNNINKIIHLFKKHSHPEKTEKEHFFKYPEQFGIRFKKDGFLFRTRSLVLNNVNVEYHGEGTPLYYDFGGGMKAPAVVKLDVSFTETKILTKADINEGM